MPADDFDFPDELLEAPAKPIDAAGLQQAKGLSDWASRFGEHGAGSGNLMTRKRHNQDIADYTDKLQSAQEAHQVHELKTNKLAQDLFIRGRKLNMDLEIGQAQLRERAQKTEAAERLLPLELQAKQAQIDLNETRTRTALNAETRKAEAEKRTLEHADALDEHVAGLTRSGVLPGTPEYFRGVEEGLRRYPFAPAQMHQDLRNAAKVVPRPEDEPVTVTRTQEVVGDGTDQLRTDRTVTSQKQSRAGFEASTPPAGADFLNQLGLKGTAPAPVAPTAQRQAPAPVRTPAPRVSPAPAKTIWREHNGVKWEYDAETKKPTGNYIGGKLHARHA